MTIGINLWFIDESIKVTIEEEILKDCNAIELLYVIELCFYE